MITGFLAMSGRLVQTKTKVEIVGVTEKRYRIKAITRTKLAGKYRWLEIGKTALVPKHAVRDTCTICLGVNGGTPGNENIINGNAVCDYCHVKLIGVKWNERT